MMSSFDYFVIFAEMRTGSNFLESNLNAVDGIQCHGEAFNPHFVGYPKSVDVLGVTRDIRTENPSALLDAIRCETGLNGFRFFSDHDPRIVDEIIADPRCAKIVLTRNPLESYVSLKIARATGQWKLTKAKHARTEKISFDAAEFEKHLAAVQTFQSRLVGGLQQSGQTAFYVDYDNLQDVTILNGLARFLGSPNRLENLDTSIKKQNPSPLGDKVSNFDQMAAEVSKLDRFNLNHLPNFEPQRGPMVSKFVAAKESPLLFMPIKSGPTATVTRWLAARDQVSETELLSGFNQKSLRHWMEAQRTYRSFSVLRHPVARAHAAYCENFLNVKAGGFSAIRKVLSQDYKIHFPTDCDAPFGDIEQHRQNFLRFLGFLKDNLQSQTSVRVDPAWATQHHILQGMSEFCVPHLILREDTLENDLTVLGNQIDLSPVPLTLEHDPLIAILQSIYNDPIEDATRKVYRRDYLNFGFENWTG